MSRAADLAKYAPRHLTVRHKHTGTTRPEREKRADRTRDLRKMSEEDRAALIRMPKLQFLSKGD